MLMNKAIDIRWGLTWLTILWGWGQQGVNHLRNYLIILKIIKPAAGQKTTAVRHVKGGFRIAPQPAATPLKVLPTDAKSWQEGIVNQLFGHFRLEWIPPEYLYRLQRNPDPVAAFQKFCTDFGLEPARLRGVPDRQEVGRLQMCVGVLADLSQGAMFAPLYRAEIIRHLQAHRYDLVEQRMAVVQGLNAILAARVQTPATLAEHRAWVNGIRDLAADTEHLLSLDETAITELIVDAEFYSTAEQRFQALLQHIELQLAHLDPGSLDGNLQQVVAGMVATKDQWTARLQQDETYDLEAGLAALEELIIHLADLGQQVGMAYQDPAEANRQENIRLFLEAMKVLGYSKHQIRTLTIEVVRSQRRRLLMKYHPDRAKDAADEHDRTHRTERINDAWNTITRLWPLMDTIIRN